MSTVQRILFEILGGLLICAAAIAWWKIHDHTEQKIGAQQCIQSTTVTKDAAIASNAEDTKSQTAELQQKVSDYETKLGNLQRNNADLAQQLLGAKVRSRPVLGAGSAAHEDLCPIELPAGQSGSAARLAKVFDDCDANYENAKFAVDEYASVRARIIAENAKRSVKPALATK